MYSRDQIDQIRSATDIVEVIRGYVPSLKSSGRSVKGLCPFHSERTPSFHVHPEKGIYKCFGCGEVGDVISFISKMEQVSFTEALEFLANQAGIQLRKEKAQVKQEPEGLKEKLFRLLESATRFYEEQLEAPGGEAAKRYLDSRSISEQTQKDFRLGFAPASAVSAFETLVKKGFSIELCQQAGLVVRSNSGRFYDPMFGRLIFPIFDSFGHVIGFGGRVLPKDKKGIAGLGDSDQEDSGPKYLNSPETPVFSKGKALYGLFSAKTNILASRRVIVLEGYMDVIGLHQGGFKTAVATLGTAFTRDHAKLLRRYADEAMTFFDPDQAGYAAAVRSLEPMLQEGFFPRVVMTEEKVDPDEILLEKGPDFLNELLNKAPDFVDFMLETSPEAKGGTLQQRSVAASQLVALIGNATNEILKSDWLGRVASRLGFRAESLVSELKRKQTPTAGQAKTDKPESPVKKAKLMPSIEEEYLHLLLSVPEACSDIGMTKSDFSDARCQRLFSVLSGLLADKGSVVIASVIDHVEPDDKEWFLQLSLEERTYDAPIERRAQLEGSIRHLNNRRRLNDLSQKVAQGSASSEEQTEYKELLRRVKGSARFSLS